jgi:hypothetical protein
MYKQKLTIDNAALNKISYNAEVKVLNSDNIGRLPFLNTEVYFSDDIWDFKNSSPEMGKCKNKYDFTDIHHEYKNYIKQYVLESLINGLRPDTINKYFSYLKKIIRFLEDNKIYNCEVIDNNIIMKFNEFLNKNLKAENERNHHKRLLTKILTYIEYDKGLNYSNLKSSLANSNTALMKAQIENGKTPQIPDGIFDKIISCGIRELNDSTIEDNEKIGTCGALLLSQIGMRIMELNLMQAGNRKEIYCFDSESKIAYVEFKTFKTTRTNNGTMTKSILTEIADLAYKKLELITQQKRDMTKSNYLFLTNKSPVMSQMAITRHNTKFMLRNAKEIGLINKSYDGFTKISKNNKTHAKLYPNYIKLLGVDEYISVPNSHQFRVTVCNKLIKEGVEFGWIVEHMNHLSPEMTKHYIREDKIENVELSRKFFKGVLTNEFKPIGERAEKLIDSINEFIERGNFNIKNDLDEIINYLSGKIPIREKPDGFCIKSAFGKKCKYNEFICAFDMCPNHISCFINADITYRRFKDKVKVIKYDKDNNFIREAEIENKKLQRLIDRSLLSELNELKDKVNKCGDSKMIMNYPKLKELVENIDKIIMEVEEWKGKN